MKVKFIESGKFIYVDKTLSGYDLRLPHENPEDVSTKADDSSEEYYSEIHLGKLREIELGDLTPQEWAKRELDRVGCNQRYDIEGDDYVENLNVWWFLSNAKRSEDRFAQKFIDVEDRLFEIIHDRQREGGWISQLRLNPDGTYDYVMEFIHNHQSLTTMLADRLMVLPNKTTIQTEQIDNKTQEVAIEGWVARDMDNNLSLYQTYPERSDFGYWDYWNKNNKIELSPESFPSITWDSEPQKVKLTITPIES